jgi:hypothetical protein
VSLYDLRSRMFVCENVGCHFLTHSKTPTFQNDSGSCMFVYENADCEFLNKSVFKSIEKNRHHSRTFWRIHDAICTASSFPRWRDR